MDVATILIAAGTVFGTKAVEESAKQSVAALWSSMKALVKRKRGADSDDLDVLDDIERLPPDTPPPPALEYRVKALQLDDDPDLRALLQSIETLLKEKAPAHIEKQYNFHGGTFHNTTFN